MNPHPGICPCAWCDQVGHIAQDCIAHFVDSSMQAQFPKRGKVQSPPLDSITVVVVEDLTLLIYTAQM